ncbi:unnamed protein product [Phyllotreta striolata]|uniref:Uncharacterized protein n=1 Tax=Phyllotreta striolata TaxID=444603 RepID=A0A9N9XJH7_PHYSR|nr:unnamed protein product [Phyllotreta striolata]
MACCPRLLMCCCPASGKPCKSKKKEKPKCCLEFVEYEYVIENLAITRAPKVCLNKKSIRTTQTARPCGKDIATLAVKVPNEVCVGPIVESSLSAGDCCAPKELAEKIIDCCACPKDPLCKPMQYNCAVRDKFKDDFILKKILLPPGQVQRIEHPKLQAAPDVSRPVEEVNTMRKDLKAIPAEIQKTIDALKVAKPQHAMASLRKNRLNLMRSVSDTSLDNKDTICNFLGRSNVRGQTTDDTKSSVNDIHFKSHKKSLSKLLQASRKTLETTRATETSLDSLSEESPIKILTDQRSLKWKIVINKHKGIFTKK